MDEARNDFDNSGLEQTSLQLHIHSGETLLTRSLESLNKLHYWYAEYTGSIHGLRRQQKGPQSNNQAQVPRNRELPPPL